MKKNYLIILLLGCSLNLIAQIPIRYSHSPNGKQIIGNYYPFLNSEFGCVNVSLDSHDDNYEKGTLKLKNSDSIIKRYIDFGSIKINEKDNFSLFSKIKKHKIEDVEYFKLGLDSFFVINKIITKEKIIEKPSVIKHIVVFDSIKYGQYYRYNYNGTLNEKFFVEQEIGKQEWQRVYLEGEPIKKLLFGYFNKFIDKKELTEEEFLNRVKENEYSKKYDTGELIYYNSSWQETKNIKEVVYTAKVVQIKDSIYNVNYFDKKENKLFEIPYSSLNPVKKTGVMKIYNNQVLESERVYSNDSLKNVNYYYPNGKIKLKKVNTLKKDSYGNDLLEDEYVNIINEDGANILKENKTILFKHDDLDVYYEIDNEKVKSSYIEENNQKVYFFTGKGKKIKTYKLKTSLNNFLNINTLFRKARLNHDLEGTKLIEITTNYKGIVVNYKILNSLGNELDELLNKYCDNNFTSKYKFKGIKLEDKSALCRFILPINFSYERAYRTFSRADNSFLLHHMMFQQQMQFHQQQFNRSFGF